jgi:hypothetical protein
VQTCVTWSDKEALSSVNCRWPKTILLLYRVLRALQASHGLLLSCCTCPTSSALFMQARHGCKCFVIK